MNYIEYKLNLLKHSTDDELGLLMSDLGDIGFESFMEEDLAIFAYITADNFIKNSEDIEQFFSASSNMIKSVEKTEIEQQNWNALWESNFSPTRINDNCVVRAPFHDSFNVEYELVIMPKMSFGTGHHETTRLMMEEIFELNVKGKKGLDMGCGTGILGILAAKCGAEHLDIIDIDQWAYDNAIENIEQNGVVDRITIKIGDAKLLEGCNYQFILANINRNILLEDMIKYVETLQNGGTLSISGFLANDVEVLKQCAILLGLEHQKTASYEKWQMMRFVKLG